MDTGPSVEVIEADGMVDVIDAVGVCDVASALTNILALSRHNQSQGRYSKEAAAGTL